MDLFVSDFLKGFHKGLNKTANPVFDNPDNSSIFSNVERQEKWHFARKDNRLHLNNGSVIHTFELPNGESSDYDFPLIKKEDLPFHEFERQGTAQVHKSDPGFLYLTLHDGKENPTYSFKHVVEDHWRATPKHKKSEASVKVDEDAFLEGFKSKLANEEMGLGASILDTGLKGINWLGKKTVDTVLAPGFSPMRAAGLGLLGGALYDQGKRHLYNTEEENQNESTIGRMLRYAAPAALLGGMGVATRGAVPNYYNHYPVYPL